MFLSIQLLTYQHTRIVSAFRIAYLLVIVLMLGSAFPVQCLALFTAAVYLQDVED